MIVIKNLFDLQSALLRGTLDPVLKNWLQKELQGLWEHLGRGEDFANFDLSQHGPMWASTSADKNMTWRQVTQSMAVQHPEFVEKHRLSDGRKAFRIGFLLDNDFMALLYSPAEWLEVETVAWLEAYTIDDDEEISEYQSDEPY